MSATSSIGGNLRRIAFWLVIVPCIVIAVVRVCYAVFGMFEPYFDVDYVKQRTIDLVHYRDSLAIERELEDALVARWRGDVNPFSLADILPFNAINACVRSERMKNSDYLNNPSADFSRRSVRPWWWGDTAQSSTIAVESADGRISAFRLVGSGYTYLGLGTRLRFTFPDRNYVCGSPGKLFFTPQRGNQAVASFWVTDGIRK
ncbi:MAG: hypothetical protein AB7O88_20410 [Reyranellaceae bacterium]